MTPPQYGQIGHDWVQATFNRELINRRKYFPGKFLSFLNDAQKVRNRADYSLELISKKIASRQIVKAREFINAIKREFN